MRVLGPGTITSYKAKKKKLKERISRNMNEDDSSPISNLIMLCVSSYVSFQFSFSNSPYYMFRLSQLPKALQ